MIEIITTLAMFILIGVYFFFSFKYREIKYKDEPDKNIFLYINVGISLSLFLTVFMVLFCVLNIYLVFLIFDDSNIALFLFILIPGCLVASIILCIKFIKWYVKNYNIKQKFFYKLIVPFFYYFIPFLILLYPMLIAISTTISSLKVFYK